MKALALRIEPQALLATSLVNTLKAARFLPDLDAVEAFLKRKCTAHTWLVTRGGSHVALVEVNAQAGTSVRRAMIAESTDKDDVFEYAEVRSEIRRIEEDARRAADLRDAPAGSGNLRTAMLEAAIRSCAYQQPVYIDRRPVMTTGMSTTTLAALAVVELGALAVEVQS